MAVRFDKKWFNPLYFILNDIFKDPTIRTVLVFGGKSSAKTISICQQLSKSCFVKGESSIAFRKESSIIPTTLKKSLNLSIDSMFLQPAFERQDRRYVCSNQGDGVSEIVMKGLDDPEKAKGIESYKFVYLDELNHFEESEYEQFNLSLRGIPGQKIIASWNPVDENSWVKVNLVDKYEFVETEYKLPCPNSYVKKSTCGKVILIKTTFEDNYWIAGAPCGTYGYRDENLISEYEQLRTRNPMSHKVNVLGEWGKTMFGGEFYKSFNVERNILNWTYDPTLPLHISFDFNRNPYMSCSVWQIVGKSCYCIDEIAMRSPVNKTDLTAREFARRYNYHKGGLFVYGDPSGRTETTSDEMGQNNFTIIMKELAKFHPKLRVASAHPPVAMRGDFINSCFDGFTDVRIYLFEKSVYLKNDLLYGREDSDGTKFKEMHKDDNGVRSQKYHHFSDGMDYLICEAFSNEFEKYQNGQGGIENWSVGRVPAYSDNRI